MTSKVACDMAWSARAFADLVWPFVARWCGGGTIERVEGQEKSTLDMYAGIDAWQILEGERAMRGIASRVQYDTGMAGYPYNTFTIRMSRPSCRTEYEKRVEAIKSKRGLIWPHLTVQAYLDSTKSELLSVAVVLTKDLYMHVNVCKMGTYPEIENKDRSSSFIAVPWGDLKRNGVRVKQHIAHASQHQEQEMLALRAGASYSL